MGHHQEARQNALSVDAAAFVRAQTRLKRPPLTPEIALHLADEALSLWQHTEKVLAREGLPPPFWAFAWAGGQALARFVLDRPALVAGRTVLDLAAGGGIVAIAAAMAGAGRVRAAEVDPFAIATIEANAAANGVRVGAELADVLEGPANADVVLAGDVFYERAMGERMLAFLQRAAAEGARVFVGDPGRSYLPRSCLTERAHYDVPVERALEDADAKRTIVWELG